MRDAIRVLDYLSVVPADIRAPKQSEVRGSFGE